MSDPTATTVEPTAAIATTTTAAPASAETLVTLPAGTGETPPEAQGQLTPPAGPANDHAWLPEKYRVLGADGQLDVAASAKKLGEGYSALASKLGQGGAVPSTPADYSYTPPDEFKDVAMDETMSAAFRERAHKAGLSNEQYQWVMNEYHSLMPDIINGAVTQTREAATAELQKVWTTPETFNQGLQLAQRALGGLPPGMGQEALDAGLGVNPTFLKIMASLGKEMGEDLSPALPGGTSSSVNVDDLMASDAYRNPRHPQHAAVSQQVNAFFRKQSGG